MTLTPTPFRLFIKISQLILKFGYVLQVNPALWGHRREASLPTAISSRTRPGNWLEFRLARKKNVKLTRGAIGFYSNKYFEVFASPTIFSLGLVFT